MAASRRATTGTSSIETPQTVNTLDSQLQKSSCILKDYSEKHAYMSGRKICKCWDWRILKLKTIFFAVICLVLYSKNSFAESLSLGLPTAHGSGCVSNSIAATVSPDQSQLSILFDSYSVEVSGKYAFSKKACNIYIPVRVPRGMKLAITQMDFRGYNFLPKGAAAKLSVDYSLGHHPSRPTHKIFRGELDADYIVTDTMRTKDLRWARCGKDTVLRINSSLKIRTNRQGEQAYSTIDSLDTTSSVVYKLALKRCKD